MKPLKTSLAAAALTLSLAACSSEPSDNEAMAEPANVAAPAADTPQPAQSSPANTAAPATPAAANVLALEGLGALRIGEAVPANSGWAERGAQISDACRTVTSPDVPGVYAIVEDSRVRRITLGQRSTVKLIEGIGVGATEADVRAAFPGFRETPHKYVEAPGKYLTAPNVESGDPALRFEIGKDGKVSLIHVGTMPVLGYVEGCA
ncbi:hypothetical protein [Allosphingosinicella vermicomposti]|uniref:hypothetical protein n=1 Tax=Allosphingosinicella vermicomposti TaxID=614671 RepID=UPI001FDF54A6|nr:hypothetical protein [Allosphingosinicella vermicomposti]